jgi:hypothetical protein
MAAATLSPADKLICDNLKPKDSPDFAKGSGTYSMKLRLMAKEKLVVVEIKGENKTAFEGRVRSFGQFGQNSPFRQCF